MKAPDGDKSQAVYHSVLITQADHDEINGIQDIQGKTMAFVDPDSTSGSLVPSSDIMTAFPDMGLTVEKLRTNGEFFDAVTFSGKHQPGLQAVIMGDVDVAPISDQILQSEIDSGNIDGNAISSRRGRQLRAIRCKVGMIFQNYNLVHQLSVLQNVLHGRLGHMSGLKGIFGRYTEEDKTKAIELLEELGLQDYGYHRTSDLSGGQKQRVGIARAIMQEPKILLCDEPIASLDPSSAKNIMDLLSTMTQKRNITCIVNLHQVDVAKKYSTRIIGLSKGKIVFDGKPEELIDSAIETIYGTSKENLMIGGGDSEQ